MKNRLDYKIIYDMIHSNSRVLDLGCGDGTLLSNLREEKKCHVTGIEIDEEAIYSCIEKGVTTVQGDIDSTLGDYSNKRFDYVILNESVQQIMHPEKVILESLRIGKKVIVGLPNFCHASARLQIFFAGQVPVTKWLPYKWYNTPNLRFLSIKDFRSFCAEKHISIVQERGLRNNVEIKILRNLFAHNCIFLLSKK
ncbi:MAG: methionine biosynthesis protein MetW [Lysobacterales bacterium]|jgi:methionine biosynthesis protein MetW